MRRGLWRVRAWLLLVPVLVLGGLWLACLVLDEFVNSVKEILRYE
jgi:hypothetical protein